VLDGAPKKPGKVNDGGGVCCVAVESLGPNAELGPDGPPVGESAAFAAP
jgi:hypothetical protein